MADPARHNLTGASLEKSCQSFTAEIKHHSVEGVLQHGCAAAAHVRKIQDLDFVAFCDSHLKVACFEIKAHMRVVGPSGAQNLGIQRLNQGAREVAHVGRVFVSHHLESSCQLCSIHSHHLSPKPPALGGQRWTVPHAPKGALDLHTEPDRFQRLTIGSLTNPPHHLPKRRIAANNRAQGTARWGQPKSSSQQRHQVSRNESKASTGNERERWTSEEKSPITMVAQLNPGNMTLIVQVPTAPVPENPPEELKPFLYERTTGRYREWDPRADLILRLEDNLPYILRRIAQFRSSYLWERLLSTDDRALEAMLDTAYRISAGQAKLPNLERIKSGGEAGGPALVSLEEELEYVRRLLMTTTFRGWSLYRREVGKKGRRVWTGLYPYDRQVLAEFGGEAVIVDSMGFGWESGGTRVGLDGWQVVEGDIYLRTWEGDLIAIPFPMEEKIMQLTPGCVDVVAEPIEMPLVYAQPMTRLRDGVAVAIDIGSVVRVVRKNLVWEQALGGEG